jgi:hypothetical protein
MDLENFENDIYFDKIVFWENLKNRKKLKFVFKNIPKK